MWKEVFRRALITCRLVDKPEFEIRHVDVQPALTDMDPASLYVVGPKQNPKWAVLSCPGACGHVMRLPMMRQHTPRWTITYDWIGRASLSPSIHQRNACKAHYWFKKGDVVWCRDSKCGGR
ncbi:DUF6527 family protein [Pseudosulfitobacter pseudonitzschiae]|uniref:DUF6527 family protein n=2 Tax=Pseudosulfitobacter pseudonitzschiae TaxID=1402135 RepID=UPI0037C9C1CC